MADLAHLQAVAGRGPDPLIAALAARRRAMRIRVADLAAAIHHGRNSIYHWEAGTRTPTIAALRAYAAHLDGQITLTLPEVPDLPQAYPQRSAYEAVRDERFGSVYRGAA